MYIHFRYKNGSNPYITTNNKNLFKMITKYFLEQTGENSFEVLHEIPRDIKKSGYQRKRFILKQFAIEWQYNFSGMRYSWEDVIFWGSFFEEYGKKYGLLREFRENGII